MPTQEEFDATLETLATYVEDIGDDVRKANIEGLLTATIRDEDYSLTGHQCEAEDNSMYTVVGHPELRYFSIIYLFSLRNNIGRLLDDDVVEALIEEDIEEDELKPSLAGKELLNRLPRGQMNALKNYIFMFVSSEQNTTVLHSDDNGVLEYYTVENLIFPYESNFNITEFHNAVQSTVSSGRRGNKLLERTIFIDSDEENLSETRLEVNFGW